MDVNMLEYKELLKYEYTKLFEDSKLVIDCYQKLVGRIKNREVLVKVRRLLEEHDTSIQRSYFIIMEAIDQGKEIKLLEDALNELDKLKDSVYNDMYMLLKFLKRTRRGGKSKSARKRRVKPRRKIYFDNKDL